MLKEVAPGIKRVRVILALDSSGQVSIEAAALAFGVQIVQVDAVKLGRGTRSGRCQSDGSDSLVDARLDGFRSRDCHFPSDCREFLSLSKEDFELLPYTIVG